MVKLMSLHRNACTYIIHMHHECFVHVLACVFMYAIMIMMLNLKATRIGIYVLKIIKIEPMNIHYFYN